VGRLTAKREAEALRRLTSLLRQQHSGRETFPSTLSRCFVASRVDDGAGNLQCFLLAMDVLEASAPGPTAPPLDTERSHYLDAPAPVRGRAATAGRYAAPSGWKVVAIPSNDRPVSEHQLPQRHPPF